MLRFRKREMRDDGPDTMQLLKAGLRPEEKALRCGFQHLFRDMFRTGMTKQDPEDCWYYCYANGILWECFDIGCAPPRIYIADSPKKLFLAGSRNQYLAEATLVFERTWLREGPWVDAILLEAQRIRAALGVLDVKREADEEESWTRLEQAWGGSK